MTLDLPSSPRRAVIPHPSKVQRGVVVSIQRHPAIGARIGSLVQSHRLDRATARAGLRGTGRRCRLRRDGRLASCIATLSPTRTRPSAASDKARDSRRFRSRFFTLRVSKTTASALLAIALAAWAMGIRANTLDAGIDAPALGVQVVSPIARPVAPMDLDTAGDSLVHPAKSFQRAVERLGIGILGAIGRHSQRLDANIHSHNMPPTLRDRGRLGIHGERHSPFVGFAPDGDAVNQLAIEPNGFTHPHPPQLGDADAAPFHAASRHGEAARDFMFAAAEARKAVGQSLVLPLGD